MTDQIERDELDRDTRIFLGAHSARAGNDSGMIEAVSLLHRWQARAALDGGAVSLPHNIVTEIENIWNMTGDAKDLLRLIHDLNSDQIAALRATRQPSSERDLLLEFAEYFNWGRNKYVDAGGYTQSRSPREAVKHFLASRQEKPAEAIDHE